jgi:hypothetical protein
MDYKDFRRIVLDNIKTDEEVLRQFLLSELPKFPIPTVQVSSNTFIERAVGISKSSGDFDLNRLSYIPDKIKHITPKGRFNNAGDPHFYGTFTDLVNPEATRYYLATEIDQSILGQQTKKFNYTVGKWKSFNGFPSILFIFNKDYCQNDVIKAAHDSYIKSKEYDELTDDQKEFLEIVTIEIAKLKSVNGYVITNIIFDYYKSKGFQSIIYPGIPSKYRGNNIAMTPEIFDKSFSFFMGAEFCLTQRFDNIDISVYYKIELLKDTKLKYSKFGDDEIGNGSFINK